MVNKQLPLTVQSSPYMYQSVFNQMEHTCRYSKTTQAGSRKVEEGGRVLVSLAKVEACECYKMTPLCHFRLGSWVQETGEGGEGGEGWGKLSKLPSSDEEAFISA